MCVGLMLQLVWDDFEVVDKRLYKDMNGTVLVSICCQSVRLVV